MASTPTFSFPAMQAPQSLERKRSSSVSKTIENPLLSMQSPMPSAAFFSPSSSSSRPQAQQQQPQRSPLSTLTINAGTPTTANSSGLTPLTISQNHHSHPQEGLRQRKVPGTSSASKPLSGPAPPPKASLSGMMGRLPPSMESSSSSAASKSQTTPLSNPIRMDPPNESDSWVVVNGYVSEQDFQAISKLFHSFGRVLDVKGAACRPGVVNWVAFRYASPLQAKKALCHSPICVAPARVLCSVHPLTPELQEALDWNSTSASAGTKTDQQPTLFLTQGGAAADATHNNTITSSSQAMLQEKDILMGYEETYYSDRNDSKRDANICEQLLGWWFGW